MQDFLWSSTTLVFARDSGDVPDSSLVDEYARSYERLEQHYFSPRIIQTLPSVFRVLCGEDGCLSEAGIVTVRALTHQDAWTLRREYEGLMSPHGCMQAGARRWTASVVECVVRHHLPKGPRNDGKYVFLLPVGPVDEQVIN